jgi:hypothetical protein
MFKFRKVADYSDGSTRVKRYDPITGSPYLVDPETNEAKPWPMIGVAFNGDVPVLDKIGMHYVANAVQEGWATLVNPRVVHRPGGTPTNPWSTTHTFNQADEVVFHLITDNKGDWVKKDYKYKVVSQPDRHEDSNEGSGWRVDWTYKLELVTVNG